MKISKNLKFDLHLYPICLRNYIRLHLTEDFKQIPEVQRLHFWVDLLSSICVSPLVLTGFQQGYSEIENQYCHNHVIHFVF